MIHIPINGAGRVFFAFHNHLATYLPIYSYYKYKLPKLDTLVKLHHGKAEAINFHQFLQ